VGEFVLPCTGVTSASALAVSSVRSAEKGDVWPLVFIKFCAQMGVLGWAGPSLRGEEVSSTPLGQHVPSLP